MIVLLIKGSVLDFLSECIQWVKANRVADSHLILWGDMNCVEYQSDRSPFVLGKSSDAQRDLKRSLNVCDVWKSVHPDDFDFTYIDQVIETITVE